MPVLMMRWNTIIVQVLLCSYIIKNWLSKSPRFRIWEYTGRSRWNWQLRAKNIFEHFRKIRSPEVGLKRCQSVSSTVERNYSPPLRKNSTKMSEARLLFRTRRFLPTIHTNKLSLWGWDHFDTTETISIIDLPRLDTQETNNNFFLAEKDTLACCSQALASLQEWINHQKDTTACPISIAAMAATARVYIIFVIFSLVCCSL